MNADDKREKIGENVPLAQRYRLFDSFPFGLSL
jgi:hypothetical protein